MYYYWCMTRLQIGIAVAVLAALVLASVAYMMLRPAPAAPTDTWTAGGGFMPWRDSTPLEEPIIPPSTDRPVETLGVVPLPVPATEDGSSGFDDLAALLQGLVQPVGPRADSDPIAPSSYAFIPQGLLSLPGTAPKTPEQQALYEYGNALALTLQAFADLHPDMPQILKDQAEDRTNSAKAGALKRLAADFIQLGDDLASMDSIPGTAASAHAALAEAYREAGRNLAVIPDATSDDAMLQAINTYNASAANLSQRLVGMIDIFVSRDVVFEPTDAGSAFMFDANASF